MSDEPRSWQERCLQELVASDDPFIQIGEGVNVSIVASRSDEMGFHYIIDIGWIVLCTCKGFRFRTDCQHVRDYSEGEAPPGLSIVT